MEEQAAEFLKLSPQTLRKRAASGEIPRYEVGGEYRYHVYDLLDYAVSPGTDRNPDRSGSDPERANAVEGACEEEPKTA